MSSVLVELDLLLEGLELESHVGEDVSVCDVMAARAMGSKMDMAI